MGVLVPGNNEIEFKTSQNMDYTFTLTASAFGTSTTKDIDVLVCGEETVNIVTAGVETLYIPEDASTPGFIVPVTDM